MEGLLGLMTSYLIKRKLNKNFRFTNNIWTGKYKNSEIKRCY